MTHLHLSTLGQCLISLARQGIKDPLHRVLRFVESGATVPNFQKSISNSHQKGDHKKQFDKQMDQSTGISSNKVRVSFKKSSAILDQINSIQQQPDSDSLPQLKSPIAPSLSVDCSIKQQIEDAKKIVSQLSPTEIHLKQELKHQTELVAVIKPYWFGQDQIDEIKQTIEGLQQLIEQSHFSYFQLCSQKEFEEFMHKQMDVFMYNPKLNNPLYLFKLMERYSLNFFEADQYMELNNKDYCQAEEYLQNLYQSKSSTFIVNEQLE